MNDTPIVKNKYRALLTEMLPYEIPLLLDNSGFYYNMLDEKLRAIFNHQFSFSNTWTIPFNYTIKKNGGIKSRLLSIMHPKIQLDFVDLYEHYELLMIHLCNISPYSLRHIHNVAKCTFNCKRLLNYILCIRFFIEVHSIVSASRFFHMPTYLRVVIECQSRFFPFFPAFSRNCPDYFLHTSGSSSFRSLSDLGAR